jgi:hypothetical protein
MSDNVTKQKQQLSFTPLYAHHHNKTVSDDTTKERHQFFVTLPS